MVKHCFSDPWKGSDCVLIVEDEKFHVHRVILSLNSPVFEAMFNSQFKEATAKEIPLPEKNASGVLDFLKIIYGFQYIQERVDITSKYFPAKAYVLGQFVQLLSFKMLRVYHRQFHSNIAFGAAFTFKNFKYLGRKRVMRACILVDVEFGHVGFCSLPRPPIYFPK